VLHKEWLQTLRFQKQQDDIGIMVHVENESQGKVDITFEFACEFATAPDA
jgi:hypothetical protein